MRKLIFLLLISPIFIASSCSDDPDIEIVGDVEVNFKANFDGEQFLTQKDYDYTADLKMKFTTLNFYVANISLLEFENSTEETEVAEIDFVDLSFNTEETDLAEAGYSLSSPKQIPVGTYRAFKIGFGVPADLNRNKPADYGEGDVLAKATHYWSPLGSYIFSKVEGFSDNNMNGTYEGNEDEGFRFHLGQDQVYTERILFPTEPITIEEGQTVKLSLDIDVKKLFDMQNSTFDTNGDGLLDIEVSEFSQSHGDSESGLFLIDRTMMGNYSSATTLNQ